MEKNKINDLLEFIKSKDSYLSYAYKMYDIYNKNLTPYVKERLSINFRSEASRVEAGTRLTPINILPKLVNKLSKVYAGAEVKVSTNFDASLVMFSNIFSTGYRDEANKMLNLNSCCALEPVFDGADSFVRVLAAHEFLVYSDSMINPTKMTHFIKIVKNGMGAKNKLYHIFTNDEFVAIDGDGNVLENSENVYGTIPFVYLKRDTTELMPRVGQDDYEMITLLPLLLTDANFALKYKAYSILYVMNAQAKDMQLGPNAIWWFNSVGEAGDKIEVGQITPTLAIDEVLKNITTLYSMWLETKNLKSPSFSTGEKSVQSLSGVAKMIDEADVTDDIASQRAIMEAAESNLLGVISAMSTPNALDINLYDAKVSIENVDLIPETPKERIDRLVVAVEKKIIPWSSAVAEVNALERGSASLEEEMQKIEAEFMRWSDGGKLQTDNAATVQTTEEYAGISEENVR